MKNLFVVGLLSVCLVAGSVAGAGDVLQQLGYSKQEAASETVFSVAVGQFGLKDHARGVLRAASPEMRAAMVEQGLIWVKAYVATPQFAQAYEQFRNENKPEPFNEEGASAEDIAQARRQYKEDLAMWNENYPPMNVAIKTRLRDFLAESANIDYNAKLVRSGTQMRFANARYESEMSGDAKRCYRAGKPAVDRARAFAQAWLNELK
ncbi:MAG: hypothetical protein M3Q69_09945 [Acidobacteriota bacterium]|nr:hypothetical protein [Acidobacteriota bacterium]